MANMVIKRVTLEVSTPREYTDEQNEEIIEDTDWEITANMDAVVNNLKNKFPEVIFTYKDE